MARPGDALRRSVLSAFFPAFFFSAFFSAFLALAFFFCFFDFLDFFSSSSFGASSVPRQLAEPHQQGKSASSSGV